jgi:hypothetical protein
VRGWVGSAVRRRGLALAAGVALIMPVSGLAAGAANASDTWQVQASPNVTAPTGEVEAVSCTSPSACTAVGYYLDSAGLYVPLAETWNGSSWKQRAVPSPAGADAPGLNGVSCVSADFCEAVGSTNEQAGSSDAGFAEIWNGSSWRVQSVAAPAGGTSVLFRAVSCASADFCEAVGEYVNSSSVLVSLAEEWNGTSWTLQSAPSQAAPTPTELDGVSCVSPDFCQAVDFYGAMVEEWNGSSWTARSVPIPSGMTSPGIAGVSCTSASFCEAVGTYVNPDSSGSGLTLLGEKWNGTSWHDQSIPNAASWKIVTAVSCASASFCEAVGYKEVFVSGTDTFRAIAAAWNGTSWHAQSTPGATGPRPIELVGVSCTTADACAAAGPFPALIETWNGTSWAKQSSVVPREAVDNALAGVSCVSATFCEAVGSAEAGPPALPEVWNGSTWRIQSRAASMPAFASVSCVSATFCEAVGSVDTAVSGGVAAAVWNGTAWQPQSTPGEAYSAVSCASATFCVAVGASGAAMWNGTSWTAESLPSPAAGYYTGVSCVSASACEAVGPGRIISADAGFAAGWNGVSWTAQTVPAPSGTIRIVLGTVSCAAPSACEAVGESTAGAYAAAWDGTAWSVQAILPIPDGAAGDAVGGVACTSAVSCTMVGYSTGSGPAAGQTLAEVWDGTSWSIQATANPAAVDNELNGVSCVTAGPCVAVGSDLDAGRYSATLAESTG